MSLLLSLYHIGLHLFCARLHDGLVTMTQLWNVKRSIISAALLLFASHCSGCLGTFVYIWDPTPHSWEESH